MLIEECMVLANEEVAKWCQKRNIPFLSRVHPAPSEESAEAIRHIIASIMPKLRLSSPEVAPRDIAVFLEKIPENARYFATRMILPKMAKALYSANKSGHFGLALQSYAHFTSPIRRYPDLITHRMIHRYLSHQLRADQRKKLERRLERIAHISSIAEKRSEGIENAVDRVYILRYMQGKIGEAFLGKIS